MTTITLEGLPENITAKTVTYSGGIFPLPGGLGVSKLMEVVINREPECFMVPCFSCSNFRPGSELDYCNYYERCLTDFINNTFFFRHRRRTPTRSEQRCAAHIARVIIGSILIPVNYFEVHMIHRVVLQIQADDNPQEQEQEEEDEEEVVNRVIGESFEEVAPKSRPCTIESVIKMLMERAELEAVEGEKAEKDWKESEEGHDCVICMEEIESVWESLKPPCSHVFHKQCLLTWLDDNHVCPLCRFELPLQEEIFI